MTTVSGIRFRRLSATPTVTLAVALAVPLAAWPPGMAVAQSVSRCVEARVDGEVSLNCLNEAWRAMVDQAHGGLGTNTLTAQSPSTEVGTFNRGATAERMGDTFGTSAFPQRPAPPSYDNPLAAARTAAQAAAIARASLLPPQPRLPPFTNAWLAARSH